MIIRLLNILFLPGCWFAPASFLRVFFHRLRGVKIGKGVEIGYFVVIDHIYPGHVIINDKVTISAGTKIIAHDDAYGRDNKPQKVLIKTGAFIGVNSVVMPGMIIGEQAIIGAQSLVIKNIQPRTVNGGVPTKHLKDI